MRFDFGCGALSMSLFMRLISFLAERILLGRTSEQLFIVQVQDPHVRAAPPISRFINMITDPEVAKRADPLLKTSAFAVVCHYSDHHGYFGAV